MLIFNISLLLIKFHTLISSSHSQIINLSSLNKIKLVTLFLCALIDETFSPEEIPHIFNVLSTKQEVNLFFYTINTIIMA